MHRHTFSASRAFRYTLLFLWLSTIIWLSLDSRPPVPEMEILGWDKLLHVIAYGCLTLLAGWAVAGHLPLSLVKWGLVVLAAIFIGAVMELLQKYLTDVRTADFWDFLANSFGASLVFIGVLCGKLLKRE